MRIVAVSLLWLAGGAAGVAFLIMALVGHRMAQQSRFAANVPVLPCARVRAGAGPVQVSGRTDVGPAGPLRARLSGAECVWFRLRVSRRYRHRFYDAVSEDFRYRTVEREVWRWDSGPFGLRDESGGVYVSPSLMDSPRPAGYPARPSFGELRPPSDRTGALGVLLADRLLPAELVPPTGADRGYRVTEEVIDRGRALSGLAVPGLLGGVPVLAGPVGRMRPLSARPAAEVLAGGARRLRPYRLGLGAVSLLCFLASALVLVALR